MWVGAIATLGIVLTAAYVLRVYQKSMTGPLNPECEGMKDLNGREITALVPIAALILVLGVFPAPLLNVINPAVDRLMTTVGVSDPEVTYPILSVPASSEGGSE
jgi:NADH-quinone oxidoreductase subunit M